MTLDEFKALIWKEGLKERTRGEVVHVYPRTLKLSQFIEKEPWAKLALPKEVPDQDVWFAFIDVQPGAQMPHPCRYLLVDDRDAKIAGYYDVHWLPVLLGEMEKIAVP